MLNEQEEQEATYSAKSTLELLITLLGQEKKLVSQYHPHQFLAAGPFLIKWVWLI